MKIIRERELDRKYKTDRERLKSRGKWEGERERQRKLWSNARSNGRALGSRSKGCGFDPHPMLDGSGVKAMPGSNPAPNSGSLCKNKNIQIAKWGIPKNVKRERERKIS